MAFYNAIKIEFVFDEDSPEQVNFGKVMIDNDWKTVDSVYVLISGVWKTISEIKININNTWKTLEQ